MKKLTMTLLIGVCCIYSQQLKAQASWELSGNASTNPSSDFVGTTDNTDLVLRTNNTERWRLTSTGNIGIGINTPFSKLCVSTSPSSTALDGLQIRGNETVFGEFAATGFSFNQYGVGAAEMWLNSQAGNLNIGPPDAFDIKFVANGSERMRMNASGNFGIGLSTPSYKLDVDGDINMSGGSILRIGGQWFLSGTGAFNVMLGFNTGQAGTKNVLVGDGAGASNQGTGINNSFLGYSAGYGNEKGSENTFIGSEAGYSNVDDYANTFVGFRSGYNFVAPTSELYGNTFVGHSSGYSTASGGGNVFMGKNAGYNSDADLNVFVGYEAGMPVSSGSQNVMLGGFAGIGCANGVSTNVFVGQGSGAYSNGNSNVYVGSGSTSLGINNTILGGSAQGPIVGIGAVEGIIVVGNGATVTRASSSSDINGAMAIGYNATSSGLDNSIAIGASASVTSANTMVLGGVNGSGKEVEVLIGHSAASGYTLDVNGNSRNTTGVWVMSDKKFKENVKEIKSALDKIRKLKPVTYDLIKDAYLEDANGNKVKLNFTEGKQIGFIAQELEQVLPELVSTDVKGYKAVNYAQMVSVLAQGIKEQDLEMALIKEENTQLLSAIDELKARLDALEQKSTDGSMVNPAGETKTVQGKLEPNEPNPFADNTVIKYFVPQTAKGATIVIRSDKAQEVMKFALEHKGNGNIIVSGNTLTAGSYNCELYVDGQLADSKKMILIK